jgi:hypothetical protein
LWPSELNAIASTGHWAVSNDRSHRPVIADGCRAEPVILKAAPQAAPRGRLELKAVSTELDRIDRSLQTDAGQSPSS